MHENVPVRFGRGRLDSFATKGLAWMSGKSHNRLAPVLTEASFYESLEVKPSCFGILGLSVRCPEYARRSFEACGMPSCGSAGRQISARSCSACSRAIDEAVGSNAASRGRWLPVLRPATERG